MNQNTSLYSLCVDSCVDFKRLIEKYTHTRRRFDSFMCSTYVFTAISQWLRELSTFKCVQSSKIQMETNVNDFRMALEWLADVVAISSERSLRIKVEKNIFRDQLNWLSSTHRRMDETFFDLSGIFPQQCGHPVHTAFKWERSGAIERTHAEEIVASIVQRKDILHSMHTQLHENWWRHKLHQIQFSFSLKVIIVGKKWSIVVLIAILYRTKDYICVCLSSIDCSWPVSHLCEK